MKSATIDLFFEEMHLKYLQRTEFRRTHRTLWRVQRNSIERFYFLLRDAADGAESFTIYAAVYFENLEDEYRPLVTWEPPPHPIDFSHNHWVTTAADLLDGEDAAFCARFELRADTDFDPLQQEIAACLGPASSRIAEDITAIRSKYLQHLHSRPRRS